MVIDAPKQDLHDFSATGKKQQYVSEYRVEMEVVKAMQL